MNKLHYFDASGRIIGDVMLFYDGSIYHAFYLLNGSGNDNIELEHAISTDGLFFHQVRTAFTSKHDHSLIGGGNIFTGGFIMHHRKMHGFITYWDPKNPFGREFIGHIVSNDGIVFEDTGEILSPGQEYDQGQQRDFRDPCVVKYKNQYEIWFLGNPKEKPPQYDGDRKSWITGIMKGKDLHHFVSCPPIHGVNDECVDLLYIKGMYYLLGCHGYAYSKHRYGPYHAIDETLETFPARAGKTMKVKGKYYLANGFFDGPMTLLKEIVVINEQKLGLQFPARLRKRFKHAGTWSDIKKKAVFLSFYIHPNEEMILEQLVLFQNKNDLVIRVFKKEKKIPYQKEILVEMIIEDRYVEMNLNRQYMVNYIMQNKEKFLQGLQNKSDKKIKIMCL